jgi:hypothetical protein
MSSTAPKRSVGSVVDIVVPVMFTSPIVAEVLTSKLGTLAVPLTSKSY